MLSEQERTRYSPNFQDMFYLRIFIIYPLVPGKQELISPRNYYILQNFDHTTFILNIS